MMMNPASISALAAIFGSIVGALGSGASTWVTQRFQERREFLNKKFAQREQLYSDFISETAKAMLDASEHSLQDPGKLIPTRALLSRIRLSSSAKVIESAKKVVRKIFETYLKPNLSPAEIESNAGEGDDVLRDFSIVCRDELDSLVRGL